MSEADNADRIRSIVRHGRTAVLHWQSRPSYHNAWTADVKVARPRIEVSRLSELPIGNMQGLYAIVDTATLQRLQLPIVDVVEAIARAEPAAIQLRAKDLVAREVLDLLRAIHPVCRNWNVPLFANDRPDLALLSGCEGVHLGQSDFPIQVARRIAPHLLIGLSTHTLEQVDDAVSQQPDYVAYGPIFSTNSKANADQVVGLSGLSAAALRCPLPMVAIGGLDLRRAPSVGRATHLGAAIAALIPEGVLRGDLSPITERARALHAALRAAS